jgi:meiotically up-regulated gene 157 (Mug157) protein
LANIVKDANQLASEIDNAIKQYGIVQHPTLKVDVYAFEVDGYGNALFMDDAGLPGLLSLPVMGYCSISDPVYQSTR